MEPEKKSNGAMVGLIIVVIILVIGGIYMWQKNKGEVEAPAENLVEVSTEALNSQDAAAIDALDQETEAVDAEGG
jgi:flagellar basal body-associated protein FliL